jgi:hypothetical protein
MLPMYSRAQPMKVGVSRTLGIQARVVSITIALTRLNDCQSQLPLSI